MTKENKDRILVQALSTFAFLAVFIGTISIYLYSNGWRLDPFKQEIIKTGVLTVESNPSLGTIYIEGQQKGRTPKSMSLPVGTYNISVEKEGYRTWNKQIEVKDEKSTPTFPWLFLEEFETENIFTLEGERYIDSWKNKTNDHIYILTEVNNEDLTYSYTIYQYDVNRAFWDLSPNPKSTFKYNSPTKSEISLNLAPNGNVAILEIDAQEEKNTFFWEINRTDSIANMQEIDISPFADYTSSWSLDSNYILFENKEELISYNLSKKTKYLLTRKSPEQKYIWTTDDKGYIYVVTENKDNQYTKLSSYNLVQSGLDGSNPITLIKEIYFQKDATYIAPYKKETGVGKFLPFRNSPQSTKSVGEIVSINVNQIAEGVYLSTTEGSYWYDMNSGMYILISANPTTFLEFSYDNKKILIQDTTGYGVFTFEKESGDHTIAIGTKYIKDLEGVTNLRWLSNSTNLSYEKDNTLFVIDRDGDNNTEIIKTTDLLYTGFNYSKEYVFTVQTTEKTINIQRILTH